jgi:hypothetical protein
VHRAPAAPALAEDHVQRLAGRVTAVDMSRVTMVQAASHAVRDRHERNFTPANRQHHEPLAGISDEAREARGGEEDPYEAADLMIAAMKDDGQPSEAVALMRRRLNRRADFPNLLWTLLVIGLGGNAPWEQEDRSRPDPAPSALQVRPPQPVSSAR